MTDFIVHAGTGGEFIAFEADLCGRRSSCLDLFLNKLINFLRRDPRLDDLP